MRKINQTGSTALGALLAVIIIAVVALAGFIVYNGRKTTTTDTSSSSSTTTADAVTAKDVTEIDLALVAFCNGKQTSFTYFMPDRTTGDTTAKVSLSAFKPFNTKDESQNLAMYANGNAGVSFACKAKASDVIPGSGAMAYLQRQTDKTWKVVKDSQVILDCNDANQLKIPHGILPECVGSDGNVTKNTN